MYVVHPRNQLCEVKVTDIFCDPNIRFLKTDQTKNQEDTKQL